MRDFFHQRREERSHIPECFWDNLESPPLLKGRVMCTKRCCQYRYYAHTYVVAVLATTIYRQISLQTLGCSDNRKIPAGAAASVQTLCGAEPRTLPLSFATQILSRLCLPRISSWMDGQTAVIPPAEQMTWATLAVRLTPAQMHTRSVEKRARSANLK